MGDHPTHLPAIEKACAKCGVTKPLDLFRAEKKNRDGRSRACLGCVFPARKRPISPPPDPLVEYRCVPGHPHYRAGSDGSIWSCAPMRKEELPGRWRMLRLGRCGPYLRASVCIPGGGPKSLFAHHLVLEAFVGPRPEGAVCRHLDGDPTNNRPSNLAWGTHRENEADKLGHGTHGVKLQAADVARIKRLCLQGVICKVVAEEFGVHESTVSRIRAGEHWSRVAPEVVAQQSELLSKMAERKEGV